MQNKHKNILIGGLLAVVFIMAIAFAGFTQQLTITDSATVSSDWNIGFESAEPSVACGEGVTGACGSVTEFTSGATQIEFDTTLVSPSDTVTYTVVVRNSGSIAAEVASVDLVEDDEDNLIKYTTSLTEGTQLAAKTGDANGTVEFTVTVTFEQTAGAIAAQSDGLTMTIAWESV